MPPENSGDSSGKSFPPDFDVVQTVAMFGPPPAPVEPPVLNFAHPRSSDMINPPYDLPKMASWSEVEKFYASNIEHRCPPTTHVLLPCDGKNELLNPMYSVGKLAKICQRAGITVLYREEGIREPQVLF